RSSAGPGESGGPAGFAQENSRDLPRGTGFAFPGRIANRRDGGSAEHSGINGEVAAVSRAGCVARGLPTRWCMSGNLHERALELGFGLWWTIPALFAVMVLLLEAARHPGEPDWMKPGR